MVLKEVFIVTVVIPISCILLIDLLIESPIKPEPFTMGPRQPWEGPLQQNDILSRASRLYQGQLRGPESIVVRDGIIYTGTADGKVLAIKDDEIKVVATLGKPPCGSFEDEPTCGRPLGMRFNKQGVLFVADAYLGLFRVDVTTGESIMVLPASQKVGGHASRFLNDLDIASDGTIYISDSSTTWDRRNNRMAIYEGAHDGRLMMIHPKTGEATVLIDGLYFANGVQLSPDESFVLVVETTTARILKYNLKGGRAGSVDVFSDNLPGVPDNIRVSAGGGYWVGIAFTRNPNRYPIYEIAAQRPWMRRVVAKIMMIEKKVFDTELIVALTMGPGSMIVELGPDGEVVQTLHDPKNKVVPSVSEVEDVDGVLYMGSYFAPFIVKLDLNKLQKGQL